MTTVKDVLIYEALENNRKYKELKKKELSDNKSKLKIEKARVKQVNTVVKNKIKNTKPSKVINIPKRKKKTKTRWQLVKELDAIFSKYIRLLDIDQYWMTNCVTCWAKVHRKIIQNWHFITRWNYKYRRREDNCFPQCMPCNIYKSWNYIAYTLFMIWRYWQERVKEMQEDKELIKISTSEIRELIEHYTNEVNIILEHLQLEQDKYWV